MFEIDTDADLVRYLEAGGPMRDLRLVALDLTAHVATLLGRRDWRGTVVLGGVLPARLDRHARAQGALVFPRDPSIPVEVYRAHLYTPQELYAGVSEGGYGVTPDARAYEWATDAEAAHDAYVTMVRAIHDDSMSDALGEALQDRSVVGVMGGHQLRRGSAGYQDAAMLGHRLADDGHVVATGGGPGAMEAANLGAFARTRESVRGALDAVAQVPSYHPDVTPWATVALRARADLLVPSPGPVRSIGIPTWFYGHEPPNVFCDGIAKYFSNATREDGLISRANAATIVLPGAAGTVQEIFQAVTPLYYPPVGARLAPLILVGVEHWTRTVPVWPAVAALAAGRPMQDAVTLVDTTQEAADLLSARR